MQKLVVVPVVVVLAACGSLEPEHSTVTSAAGTAGGNDKFSTNGCFPDVCLAPDNLEAVEDARYSDLTDDAEHYLRVCADMYGVTLFNGVAMDPSMKKYVFACYVGHVNAYGIHVLFNARSEPFGPADIITQQIFPFHEIATKGDFHVNDAWAFGGCAPESVDNAFRRVCSDGLCKNVMLGGAAHDHCITLGDHADAWCDGEETFSAFLLAVDGELMECLANGKCGVADELAACEEIGLAKKGRGFLFRNECIVCAANQQLAATVDTEGQATASCVDSLTVGGEDKEGDEKSGGEDKELVYATKG